MFHLLQLHDQQVQEHSEHPDEETLAMFIEGIMDSEAREQLIPHLADCRACRQLVSAAQTSMEVRSPDSMAEFSNTESALQEGISTSNPLNKWKRRFTPVTLAVIAASLLLLLMWRPVGKGQMTESFAYTSACQKLDLAEYAAATSILTQASKQGVQSDRLKSLQSQAIRQLPGKIALASAGSLLDIGYELDGTVARSAVGDGSIKQAEEVLGSSTSQEVEFLLNRGHLRLSQNDFAGAITDFSEASIQPHGNEPAWLGLSLAYYASGDFEAALTVVNRYLKLAPESDSGLINRAMILEELGRIDEAISDWNKLITSGQLVPELHTKIQLHLNRLN